MKHSPCLLIIDFDGVLFNDKRFKKECESLFQHAGVSQEQYEKTYLDSKKQKGHYDPRIHIRLALGSSPAASVAEKNLFARIKNLMDQSFRYVYGDVKEFLAFLKEVNIDVVLLSTGDASFQNQKIIKSGIAESFNEIVVVPDTSKVSALDLIMRKKRPRGVMFVDDKKEVVDGVKQAFPGVYTVQMRRDETQSLAQYTDFSVNNFSQLTEFVQEWKAIC